MVYLTIILQLKHTKTEQQKLTIIYLIVFVDLYSDKHDYTI